MCAINTDCCAIKRDSKKCERGVIIKLYHFFFCNYSLNLLFVMPFVFVLSTTLCLMILSFS